MKRHCLACDQHERNGFANIYAKDGTAKYKDLGLVKGSDKVAKRFRSIEFLEVLRALIELDNPGNPNRTAYLSFDTTPDPLKPVEKHGCYGLY